MPKNADNPPSFWQELKRRKVVRVITVYAAAAFVILELLSIIIEPLRLPDWTLQFAIVFLCIGFIVAVILSWIYDIHPEEGIVKTEPAHKAKKDAITKSSNGWKIASYISFAVIIGLIILNIIPRSGRSGMEKVREKSIAVLPFRNESSDEQNTYFINGTMEAILDNLCKIEDLRVPGRTSVEQYRDAAKPIPAIAKEMNVNYVLEGSGQKMGNRILLTVQLLDGKSDQHLWSKQYDRNIRSMEELIDLESEIAKLIAGEIKAIITPEEEELMNRLPTTSMTAYDLYLKANEYQKEYTSTSDLGTYQTAVSLYRLALETDSTFARAYTGLARAYYNRYYWPEFFTDDFLDSCLVMANTALSIDDKLDDAYYLRGLYYRQNGNLDKALSNYDKAIEINPNFYSAYTQKGYLYTKVLSDNVKGMENYHTALKLVSGEDRPSLLRTIGDRYSGLGFMEKAKQYLQEALDIDGDRRRYLTELAWMEFNLENYEKALRLLKEASQIDTTYLFNLHFYIYTPEDHIKEAYEHALKVIHRAEQTDRPFYYQSHRIGYIFHQMGKIEEAKDYFKLQINYSEESIKLNRFYSQLKHAHYDLSATYAFLGDKEKAYQQLDDFNTMKFYDLGLISFVKGDPLYASIRNEDRFQKILQDMSAKFQAEHERVRKWLEENDML
jgi:TolB-like protein/Tfp pilus assembly protein PilF